MGCVDPNLYPYPNPNNNPNTNPTLTLIATLTPNLPRTYPLTNPTQTLTLSPTLTLTQTLTQNRRLTQTARQCRHTTIFPGREMHKRLTFPEFQYTNHSPDTDSSHCKQPVLFTLSETDICNTRCSKRTLTLTWHHISLLWTGPVRTLTMPSDYSSRKCHCF